MDGPDGRTEKMTPRPDRSTRSPDPAPRSPRLLRAAGALCAIALAGACSFEGSLSAGGGGCYGATGSQGNVAFSFEQAPLQDLSAASGRAFAADTYSRFRVDDLTGAGLDAHSVESSDSSVLTVQDDTDRDWPLRIKFHRPGTAALRIRSTLDGTLLDSLDLRVAEPAALELIVGPALSPQLDGGGVSREPPRVVLAHAASCRVFLRASDASGQTLFGAFSPSFRPVGTSLEVVSEGMGSLQLFGDAVYATARITAAGGGEAALHIEGPNGLARELAVAVPDAAALASLRLVFWPDDLSEAQPGQDALLVAVGRDADGSPVYGFPIAFSTIDESVAVVGPAADPDVSVVSFIAPGTARILAHLQADPSVETSISVDVVPSEN
jgi:hypothetical protein